MYKIFLLTALAALLLAFTACGRRNQEEVAQTTPAPTVAAAVTTTPQATAPPATAGVSVQAQTVIIYTANIRGNISVLPHVAALRNYYEAQGFDVILVDMGNFLQGTIYAAYDSGRTVIELMDMAGYDVVVIGASEFAFGTGQVGVETHGIIFADDSFGYLIEQASFYAISANIIVPEYVVYAFQPYAIIETAAGASVAIIGTTDARAQHYAIEGTLEGLFFDSQVVALDDYFLLLRDNDIRIGFTGLPSGGVSAWGANTYVAVMRHEGLTAGVIVMNNATNSPDSHYIVDLTTIPPAPAMQAAVNLARAAAQAEFGIWATSEVTLEGRFAASRSGETNLGNLWADALRWFALYGEIENFFDEDDIAAGITGIMVEPQYVVAIWNGGNLRDFIHVGDVTMRDLQRVLPFPNRVAVMYLYGYQLAEMLEAATQGLPFTDETFARTASFPHVAGINFTVDTSTPFDAGEPHGNHWFRANSLGRVIIHSINGQEFNLDTRYAIITSNAIFNGMDSNYISLYRCEDYSTITSAMVVDAVWMYIMQELGGVIGREYAVPQGRIAVR